MMSVNRCNREWLWFLLLLVSVMGWHVSATGAKPQPSKKPADKKPFPGAAPPFKPKGGGKKGGK